MKVNMPNGEIIECTTEEYIRIKQVEKKEVKKVIIHKYASVKLPIEKENKQSKVTKREQKKTKELKEYFKKQRKPISLAKAYTAVFGYRPNGSELFRYRHLIEKDLSEIRLVKKGKIKKYYGTFNIENIKRKNNQPDRVNWKKRIQEIRKIIKKSNKPMSITKAMDIANIPGGTNIRKAKELLNINLLGIKKVGSKYISSSLKK